MKARPKTTTDFTLEVVDCVKGMRNLAEESVDIVVTSPPYNLGIKYQNYSDTRSRDEYLIWCQEWAREIKRLLKSDGSLFLNLGSAPSNPLIPHELIVELKKMFVLQNTFHWIKSITIETRSGDQISAGHFKPIHSKRFVNDCHEYIFHLTKNGNSALDRLAVGVPYSDKSNIARWSHTAGRDVRCRGNTWFIPYRTIVSRSKQRPHPATFPVELAENCIRIHGVKSDTIVLDPFVGIGHSALAAKLCSVPKFIGFDIDPEYIEVAKSALADGRTQPTEALRTSRSKRSQRNGNDAVLF
jgi:site-specific DNA-methyltransferase (adenine-specific)